MEKKWIASLTARNDERGGLVALLTARNNESRG